MTRRVLSLLLAIPFLTVLAPTPAMAASQAVTMAQYAFAPASLTVHVGDSITWTNHDQAPHDVTTTAGPVAVHSPMLTTGQSWTYTFTQPGAYAYLCSIHPDMKAAITVLAAPTTAPPPQRPAPTTAVRRPTVGGAPVVVEHPTTTTAPPTTTSAAPQVMQTMAPTDQSTLDPMLLVAGLVAAVATLCLLLIASRAAD
jgi:plastocyanin